MIYLTGDTHGDFERFSEPTIRKLKSKDVLIVCGDFGFVWAGTKAEKRILKKIGRRRFDTLFVEGCHDNYDLLAEYPVVPYKGGNARKISGNLYQLIRGEVYEICGKTVFAFGGGDSGEAGLDYTPGNGWWQAEQPCEEERQHGLDSLKARGGKVDIIVSHDIPAFIKLFIHIEENRLSPIHEYLEEVSKACKFERWFFGRYHMDKTIPPRYYGLYKSLHKVE